jgi:plastocyanin
LAALAVAVIAAAVTGCVGLPAPPGDDKVTIQDLKFIPTTLEVRAGATVTWTNKDATAHTVTSDDFPDPASTSTPPPGSFTSQPLNPGATFSHRFDKAGKYDYHCQIHPYLKGTVVVK